MDFTASGTRRTIVNSESHFVQLTIAEENKEMNIMHYNRAYGTTWKPEQKSKLFGLLVNITEQMEKEGKLVLIPDGPYVADEGKGISILRTTGMDEAGRNELSKRADAAWKVVDSQK